jgi:ketosteroid isomerase-like protein
MEFSALLREFAAAVEAGDGKRLGALFTPEGVYHDTFYGEFKGAEAIRVMLEERFYRDATRFYWDFFEPVSDGKLGYAKWAFSYTSKMAQNAGKRVALEGVSQFELSGGKIKHYGEVFNSGAAFVQLGFDPARTDKVLRKHVDALKALPRFARHVAE